MGVDFDSRVRRSATIATIVALMLVALTTSALLVPAIRRTVGLVPATSEGYAIGQQVDVPPDVYGSTAQTLIIFSRSTCGGCQAAKPLIATITERLSGTPEVRVVVATSRPTASDEIRFAESIGLDRTRLVGVNFRSLRLRRVPTMLLVEPSGQIHYVREGVPSAVHVEEIISAVTSPPR